MFTTWLLRNGTTTVLITCCSWTNCPKLSSLKVAHIYNLTVHGTRNLGRLSWILCSRVSQAQSRCQIRLLVLPGGVAGEGTAPRLTPLLVGFGLSWAVRLGPVFFSGVVGQRFLLVLSFVGLSIKHFIAWQFASLERAVRRQEIDRGNQQDGSHRECLVSY